jgi:uncharacterized protein YuzE
MVKIAIEEFLNMLPAVKHSPRKFLWSSYDPEGDVLYINFKKPSHATDSELTDNDIIVRYEGKEIVGVTILNAMKYKKKRVLKWDARAKTIKNEIKSGKS